MAARSPTAMSLPRRKLKLTRELSLEEVGCITKDGKDIVATVLSLQERVDSLEKENERLSSLVRKLWFAPGMPGAIEAESDFNATRNLTATHTGCLAQIPSSMAAKHTEHN